LFVGDLEKVIQVSQQQKLALLSYLKVGRMLREGDPSFATAEA
jgi:hypothetical protein